MTRRRRQARFSVPLLAAGLVVLGAAHAGPPGTVVERLRGCAAQHDSARRLACYDQLARSVFAAPGAAATPADTATPSDTARPSDTAAPRNAAAPRSPASTQRARPFPPERPERGARASGDTPQAARTTQPPPTSPSVDRGVAEFGTRGGPLARRHEVESPGEITGVVQHIGERAYGQVVITLDNGQTWLQNEPMDYFPLKAGDSVVIRKAALGSYLLFAPFKRSTRVTRVR
jgi:hypothetical protein